MGFCYWKTRIWNWNCLVASLNRERRPWQGCRYPEANFVSLYVTFPYPSCHKLICEELLWIISDFILHLTFCFSLFSSLIWDRHCFPSERTGIFLIYPQCALSLMKTSQEGKHLWVGFTGCGCEHSWANARNTQYEWLVDQSAFPLLFSVLPHPWVQISARWGRCVIWTSVSAPWLLHGLK